MMPLLLFLYATPFTSQKLQIPYGNIVVTLLLVLVPVVFGILIRRKNQIVAAGVEKAGSFAGIAVLILLIISGLFRNLDLLKRTTIDMYLCATLLGVVGFLMGYISSKVFRMSEKSARAVAFETGIQNSPLAFGIIIASFQGENQIDILWLPMLYALMVLLSGLCLSLVFRRWPKAGHQAV
ncbi:MAG: bile acid:sodium symporter [Pseudomonadota bacterium]